jgi:hypothetical protein
MQKELISKAEAAGRSLQDAGTSVQQAPKSPRKLSRKRDRTFLLGHSTMTTRFETLFADLFLFWR